MSHLNIHHIFLALHLSLGLVLCTSSYPIHIVLTNSQCYIDTPGHADALATVLKIQHTATGETCPSLCMGTGAFPVAMYNGAFHPAMPAFRGSHVPFLALSRLHMRTLSNSGFFWLLASAPSAQTPGRGPPGLVFRLTFDALPFPYHILLTTLMPYH